MVWMAERWVGSCRRDLLDHIIAVNERHLKRLLSEYTENLGIGRVLPVRFQGSYSSVRDEESRYSCRGRDFGEVQPIIRRVSGQSGFFVSQLWGFACFKRWNESDR